MGRKRRVRIKWKLWGAAVLQIGSGLAACTGERGFHHSLYWHTAEMLVYFCFFVYHITVAEMTPRMNHIICHLHSLGELFSSIFTLLHSAASVEAVAYSLLLYQIAARRPQLAEVQFRGFLEALVATGSMFFS